MARTHLSTFIRFAVVGTLCAALNLAFLWVFTDVVGVHYLLSTALSFVFINGVGFALNKYYAFNRPEGSIVSELARYYSTMFGSVLANLALMAGLVELLDVHYLAASIVVTCLLMIANFLVHDVWTFAIRKPRRP